MSDLDTENISVELDHKRLAMTGQSLAVITVCSFILMGFILWRQDAALNSVDERNEAVSSLRISQCHQIQKDSILVMKEVSKSLAENSKAMNEMDSSIDELRGSVDRNSARIEQLIMKK